MVKNNTLAEKLNLYKSGESTPASENNTPLSEEEQQDADTEVVKNSMTVEMINYATNISFFVVRCLAYGYSIKTIFNTDWSFVALCAVGLSVETITSKLLDVFRKT